MEEGKRPLSYAQDLWDEDGFDAVCSRVHAGVKTTEQVLAFLKDKISLDNQSCRVLTKMSKTNLGSHETASLQSIVNSFVGLSVTTSVNHEILAAKLSEQVRDPLARLLDIISKNSKRLMNEGRRLQRDMKLAEQRLDKCKHKYEQKSASYQQVRAALRSEMINAHNHKVHQTSNNGAFFQQLMPSPIETIEKLTARQISLADEVTECKEGLIEAVSFMRGFRLTQDAQMSRILDELQQLEVDRRVGIRNCLQKYFAVSKAMHESMVKNVSAVSRLMDDLNIDKDIQYFVAANMTGRTRPPLPELSFDDDRSDRVRVVDSHEAKLADQTLAEGIIQLCVDSIFAGEKVAPQQLDTLKNLFKTPGGRAAFATVLTNQRTNDTGLALKGDAFEELASIIKLFLDGALPTLKEADDMRTRDALFTSTIRPCKLTMIMSQSFYRIIDKSPAAADSNSPSRHVSSSPSHSASRSRAAAADDEQLSESELKHDTDLPPLKLPNTTRSSSHSSPTALPSSGGSTPRRDSPRSFVAQVPKSPLPYATLTTAASALPQNRAAAAARQKPPPPRGVPPPAGGGSGSARRRVNSAGGSNEEKVHHFASLAKPPRPSDVEKAERLEAEVSARKAKYAAESLPTASSSSSDSNGSSSTADKKSSSSHRGKTTKSKTLTGEISSVMNVFRRRSSRSPSHSSSSPSPLASSPSSAPAPSPAANGASTQPRPRHRNQPPPPTSPPPAGAVVSSERSEAEAADTPTTTSSASDAPTICSKADKRPVSHRRTSSFPQAPREYIQVLIKDHPLWRDMRFWREAFDDAVTAELRKHQEERRWLAKSERLELARTRENILFSQLASWVHNMTQFGVGMNDTLRFVSKSCDRQRLDPRMVQMLVNMVSVDHNREVPTNSPPHTLKTSDNTYIPESRS